jgi:hypothetical protein
MLHFSLRVFVREVLKSEDKFTRSTCRGDGEGEGLVGMRAQDTEPLPPAQDEDGCPITNVGHDGEGWIDGEEKMDFRWKMSSQTG